jgi:DNA-binding SARP family transcriptional activator
MRICMSVLSIQLLGDLQLRTSDGALFTIPGRKPQAVLAYLAMRPSQHVSRDKIAALIWSSTAAEQGRQSLRQTLSTLRKELAPLNGSGTLLVEEGDLLAVDAALVSSDVARFESSVAAGTEDDLLRALDLYKGDLLDGLQLNEERFDQWLLAERDRLRRLASRACSQLIQLQSKRGAIDEAIGSAQRALAIDPLQESMHRSLMRLYLEGGHLVDALQQYEALTRMLKRELGAEPDAESKALQRDIAQRRSKVPLVSVDAAVSAEPRTVLIVEDNVLNRELTQALLRTAGYAVRAARDGAEALMMLGRERVDLLLLDIDLPFIDGHRLLEAIRDQGLDVPAIFLSGLPGDEPEVRAFDLGAADFIRKPVKNNVLLARVARVLK